MKTIKTTAPIAIEDLKQYFADNTINYVIDYSKSALKGAKILTYLSNLDLPCDIEFEDSEQGRAERIELLKEYFNSPLLVNIASLEQMAISVLQQYKGLGDYGLGDFIEENSEIITKWVSVLDSLSLYNMYIVDSEEMKGYAKSFPNDADDSTRGINFVSVLKHEDFYGFYDIVNKDSLKFYPTYFDSYMYKGKSLYNFWAVENNPLFVLTWGIATGIINGEQEMAEAKGE